MALLLSRSDVQKLLPMSKAIDVVEGAFSELANGTAEMPPRTVLIDPEVGGWIAYMPSYLKSGGALGVKASITLIAWVWNCSASDAMPSSALAWATPRSAYKSFGDSLSASKNQCRACLKL